MVGVPDEKWGELVTAVVVVVTLDDPPSGADLIAHCRDRLAGYKCPKRVEFVDSCPEQPPGKSRSSGFESSSRETSSQLAPWVPRFCHDLVTRWDL